MKITINNYLWYTALLLWAVFSIILFIKAATTDSRSLWPLYNNVGTAWLNGEDLYSGACKNYMYWIGFGTIISFFAAFPYWLGSLLWSILSISIIFIALYKLSKTVFDANYNKIGMTLLLSFPLAFEGLLNQQSNAFITALALLGAVYIYKERLWLGSFLLLLSAVTKIAPIAFVLLFLVIYPKKLWWRFMITGIIILLLPFIFQDSEYVFSQYQSWINALSSEGDLRWMYRDFWTLYELVSTGSVITHEAITDMGWYRIVQLSAAGLVCLICMYHKYYKGFSRKSSLVAVVISGSIWWLLFGPSTEIATCISGAGAASLATILAKDSRRGWWLMAVAYPAIAIGSIGDFEFNIHLLFDSDWGKGLLPFGSTLLFIWLCYYFTKSLALTIEPKKVE